ncbi:MAG TPA: CoA pyrophosphatase [Syntrophomonadaceae bacterium]|nr:CoA pyrophosphatase [Syntrophomonadaceae bacterium]
MLNKISKLQGRNAEILGMQYAFRSAVLLPLVEVDGRICVLFEKRASNLMHQPGEISFPGGKIEPTDESIKQGAIRETCEELGLEPKNIKVIADLDITVSPFNVIVYPFVAFIDDIKNVQASPDEVEEAFYVPLDYLLEKGPVKHDMWLDVAAEQDFPFDLIPQGKDYPFRRVHIPQLFWIWNEHVIWGLTARILNNFIALLKSDL